MKKNKSLNNSPSPGNLEEQAACLLVEKKYKQALETYKTLYKKDPKDFYKSALSQCYMGRINDLSAKDMYREAVVLWENHHPYCGPSCQHAYVYINLLLAAGLEEKAASFFTQNKTILPDTHVTTIEEIFAGLILNDVPKFVKYFQEDSPLRKHLPFVQKAIDFYNLGDRVQMDAMLCQIPFRSPYKDIRQILKGILLLNSDKTAALSAFRGIKDTSPFSKLASLSVLAFSSPFDLSTSLKTLNTHEFRFLSMLNGWGEDREKYLARFRNLPPKIEPSTIFDLITSGLNFMTSALGKKLIFTILPFYKNGLKYYEKTFQPLSEEQSLHLKAQQSSVQNKGKIIESYDFFLERWLAYEDFLKTSSPQSPPIKLKRALILRYLEEVDSPRHPKDCFCKHRINNLEKTLGLDPYDKSIFLKVINYYDKKGPPETYQLWMEKALKSFSEDREFLTLGIENAWKTQSLEHGLDLTEKLLKIDATNKNAQNYLRKIRLRQAQNFMLKKEWETADSLLNKGETKDFFNVRITLNRVLLEYLQNHISQAHSLMKVFKNDFKSMLQFYIDAKRLQISLSPLTKKLNLQDLSKIKIETKEAFLDIIQMINETALDLSWDTLTSMVKKQFEKTIFSYIKEELSIICKCFTKIKAFDLVTVFITKTCSHLKKEPIFIFYRINAHIKGKPSRLTANEFIELEEALEQAQWFNDIQASHLINTLLSGDSEEDADEMEMIEESHNIIDSLKNIVEQLQKEFSPQRKKEKTNKKDERQGELF